MSVVLKNAVFDEDFTAICVKGTPKLWKWKRFWREGIYGEKRAASQWWKLLPKDVREHKTCWREVKVFAEKGVNQVFVSVSIHFPGWEFKGSVKQ